MTATTGQGGKEDWVNRRRNKWRGRSEMERRDKKRRPNVNKCTRRGIQC